MGECSGMSSTEDASHVSDLKRKFGEALAAWVSAVPTAPAVPSPMSATPEAAAMPVVVAP